MTLDSTQLQALVDAARQTGERDVTVSLADGTLVTVHFQPPPAKKPHPIRALLARVANQKPQLN